MSHLRTGLRAKVAALVTGLTLTTTHVFQSRVYPLDSSKLPGLIIYTGNESVTTLTMSYPRTQERRLEVVVEVYVRAVTGYDTLLDDIIEDVEVAIGSKPTLDGLAKSAQLSSIRTQFTGEAEQPCAIATMTFDVVYTMKENAPGGA